MDWQITILNGWVNELSMAMFNGYGFTRPGKSQWIDDQLIDL